MSDVPAELSSPHAISRVPSPCAPGSPTYTQVYRVPIVEFTLHLLQDFLADRAALRERPIQQNLERDLRSATQTIEHTTPARNLGRNPGGTHIVPHCLGEVLGCDISFAFNGISSQIHETKLKSRGVRRVVDLNCSSPGTEPSKGPCCKMWQKV